MLIVINFKTYKKGKQVLQLAKLIYNSNKKAIIAIPFSNLKDISKKTKLAVFSQQLTKQFNAKKIKSLGANGTLLNHSEHRLKFDNVKQLNNNCNKVGLKVIICASNLSEAKQFIKLKPYAIAFEDPKLIGTGKSITKYKSKDVEKFVKMLSKSKVLPMCGAGISTSEDIKQAKKLGCKGVLIASAIAKVKNPEKLLKKIKK